MIDAMSIPAASNSEKPPQEDSYQPSSFLSSLPDDVVLNCLTRVPRCDDLNISCVSKTLRSLVRSPELCRLRSRLPKKSVYLFYSFRKYPVKFHWITLRRRGEETTTHHDYQWDQRTCSWAVPLIYSYSFMKFSSAVSVGSEIYFLHWCLWRGRNVWVFDTRSGTLRRGRGMKNARLAHEEAVGVVDGKIYVIGGSVEESRVEVFDPETQTWDFAGEEKVQCKSLFSASLEHKVYMVDSLHGRISAYSPREGISNETTETLSDQINCMCVVENVIYACFESSGLMWFDAKLKVWRRLVDSDGKVILYSFNAEKMAEYEGKLAVFWTQNSTGHFLMKMDIRCRMIALDRVGDEIRGNIEWSGIMGTFPYDDITLRHCLVVSSD